MKLSFPSFWLKLVLANICVAALSVAILGWLSYLKSLSMTEEQARSANERVLQQYQMRAESMLRSVERQVFQLAQSQRVLLAVRDTLSHRDFAFIRELEQDLNRLQTIDLPIHNALLLGFNGNWLIDNTGFNLNSGRFDDYKRMREVEPWTLNQIELPNGSPAEMIVFAYPIPDSFSEPEGLLVVEMLADDVNRWMTDHSSLGKFQVLDAKQQPIIRSSGGIGTSELHQLAEVKLTSETDVYGVIAGTEANQEWLFYRKSALNRWTYVSTVSRSQMAKESAGIGWLAFYTCISVLLCMTVVSLIMTRTLYVPVRKLYEAVQRAKIRPERKRTYDELETIAQEFNSLRYTEEHLSHRMQSQTVQLRDLFLIELIQGKLQERELDQKIALYGLPSDWKQLCVMAIDIDTLAETRYNEQDYHLLLYGISNMIQEIVPQNRLYHQFSYQHLLVVILRFDDSSQDTFLKLVFEYVKIIQEQVERFLQLSVSIGLSRIFYAMARCAAAYRESVEALKYRMRVGGGALLYIDDLEPSRSRPPTRVEEHKRELTQAIKMGDDTTAKAAFRLLLSHLVEGSRTQQDDRLALLLVVMDIAREVLGSSEAALAFATDSKSLQGTIMELKTAKETEYWFEHQVLTPLCRQYEERLTNQYRSISADVIRLIETYYDKPISLEICSAQLHYSPDYIKRVFRKETGVSFSDYVAHYRLKLAKEWLAYTEMSVSEIAEKLQYSNIQNFSRYFRKMETMTPSEYRTKFQV
ncbi:helix-turn-helix domain-containing protein [Paenibacillus filicis]|uniref:Helix-turn-helix domain-containing protein n=1 Tax=Paenibacillus gyeongsangnamensis TaxID=3388067 RepID=A0ABT4QJD1_9BACL|nr:helix-turn-helix domain-containing protein [Paenibacillus filicis]MCZ8516987.1 helix-turn-helix domain-containing protein [Paenibacillus filicis]